MYRPKLGLGRDFFELLRPSSVRSIFLKEKLEWGLYYLQITKGFTMPDIEIFYDKPLTSGGYVFYCDGKEYLSGSISKESEDDYDFFEKLLYELLSYLDKSPQILFNEDAYEFWLEHSDFYNGNTSAYKEISMETCKNFLEAGYSLSLRKQIISNKKINLPECTFQNKEEFKRFLKGLFLLADGKINESSAVFNEFSENSHYIISHFKGETALFQGELDFASELMSICMEKCPYYADVLYLSAAHSLSKGNPYRCCQILKEGRILYPGNVMFNFLLAKMYSYMDKEPIARRIINKTIQENHLFPGLLLDYALINYQNFEKAETILKTALKMNSKHVPVCVTLASLYFERGENGKALEIINETIKNNPERAECWNLKGKILQKSSKFSEAEQAYKTAATIDRMFIYNLALFYIACGQNEKALPILKTYLTINPYNKKAYKYIKQITDIKKNGVSELTVNVKNLIC